MRRFFFFLNEKIKHKKKLKNTNKLKKIHQ